MQMLLALENEAVLVKIKSLLLKSILPAKDETAYLNSIKANRKALEESINQLNQGKGKTIKTQDLWK
jgi:cell division protein FtsB